MGGAGVDGGAEYWPRPRLGRTLLGVKRADVERELAARDAEIDELRKDLAALWQAYAQQDLAIREALTAPREVAREEGAPEGSAGESTGPSPEERRAEIEAQLSGLDEALAAIEQATQTLESAYRVPSPATTPSPPTPTPGEAAEQRQDR